MRLPVAIVLLLFYTASGVVGQPRIVNPGEPNPDELVTTTSLATETSTTASTTSTLSSSSTSSDTTSSSISTTSTTSSATSTSTTDTATAQTTTTEVTSTTTESSSSSSSTSSPSTSSSSTSSSSTSSSPTSSSSTSSFSSSSSLSTTTTTTEPSTSSETTTSETTTSETTTSTSESSTSTTESETSTTELTSTTSSTTTTSSSESETSTTTESTSTTESEASTTETSTTTPTTTSSSTTTSEESSTTTTESSTSETTTSETTTSETTTSETTTSETTTSETTTSETTSESTTSESTTSETTIGSTSSEYTTESTTTTTEPTTTDSSTESSTSESDTATTTSDSTTTDSTSSETTSTTRGTVTEYVYPTDGCKVSGAKCHFYRMELAPTVYFVTTLTVDESATTSAPNFTYGTVAGFSSDNPDITTIQANDTILSNTGNIIPSSLATASDTDEINLVLPTTYQFIFSYDLPDDFMPTDPVASSTDDTDIPLTTSEACPENTVLVTIPAYSDFSLSVFKGCSQYEAFANFTRTLVITTKTAVVIETKGKDSIDGFGAASKSKDPQSVAPPNSRPTENTSTTPRSGDREEPAPVQTSSQPDRPNFGPVDPKTSDRPNKGPNENPDQPPDEKSTKGPNQDNTRASDSEPTKNLNDRPGQLPSETPGREQTTDPGPTPLPSPNPNPSVTGSSRSGSRTTINPDDFTLLIMPTSSRAAPGQTVAPGPNPTERRNSEPSIEPVPVVRTISGTRTTTTSFVGITNVPKTSVIRMPGGGSSTIIIMTESRIPITSFQPRVNAEPVVTTINGRRTTFLTVLSVSAKPTVVLVTTSIDGRRTVLSSTFFLPVTVPVPQFTPFLTTTIGPTIINGLPTLGPTVITLAPLTRTTFLTDVVSGTTMLRRTTYILPATSTLPNPLVQTLRVSTVVDGTTTTVNFPISLSAAPTTRVITTTVGGTRRVFTTTFFVPQGVPILDLPSVIFGTTTINGRETTISEFYSIKPVSVTTTIGGRETVVIVPSAVPITTPRTFFSTSYLRTTVNGRTTSIPEVYFLKPTTTTTVIQGRTSVIRTTTAVLVSSAPSRETTSTRGPSSPGNSTSSNSTITAAPKTGPTTGIPLIPVPSQTGSASSISLASLFTCLGALISAILMTLL